MGRRTRRKGGAGWHEFGKRGVYLQQAMLYWVVRAAHSHSMLLHCCCLSGRPPQLLPADLGTWQAVGAARHQRCGLPTIHCLGGLQVRAMLLWAAQLGGCGLGAVDIWMQWLGAARLHSAAQAAEPHNRTAQQPSAFHPATVTLPYKCAGSTWDSTRATSGAPPASWHTRSRQWTSRWCVTHCCRYAAERLLCPRHCVAVMCINRACYSLRVARLLQHQSAALVQALQLTSAAPCHPANHSIPCAD